MKELRSNKYIGEGWTSTTPSTAIADVSTGKLLDAPGAGKAILILDILSAAATLRTDASGGTNIAKIPEGMISLNAPILCPANEALYSTAAITTITYITVTV